MRHPISKIAALALVAPLAGTFLLAGPASAAPAKAPAAAVKKADDPFSTFVVQAAASKTVRPGKKITYTIKATNSGPYVSDGGAYFIVAVLPKSVILSGKWTYQGPAKSECASEEQVLICAVDKNLKVKESVSFKFAFKVAKTAKGTLKSTLGVLAYDVPTGAETLSRDELERLGVKSWLFGKNHSTRVAR
ncbi:conserved repeat domain-containing protein [Streptosporangium subroseum]|uniref:Conserved repeat domain-containing protein n=1 Tax=Streptosporangium subroseum TaxID=106412 RepID=A0A239IFT0_9ACTN|nr:DUF11 domain-containing protein [Streptosporangium subroseum]SNS92510.1 conserved repeat domain-containing protein [Streptosporangium subroseum]